MGTRTPLLALSLLTATAALAASACIAEPDFDDRDLVKTPRILAIVAEPPELAPGEASTLSVLFADPLGGGRPIRYRWKACVATESLGGGGAGLSGVQYGMDPPEEGCSDPAGAFDLGVDETALLLAPPEASIDMLVARFRALVGDAISEEFIQRLLTDVGIQITVQVDVITDGPVGDQILITGYKRVIVSRRAQQGTNPPRPRFALGTAATRELGVISAYAPGGSGFDCATESGEPVVVPPRTLVDLRPDPTPQDPLDAATDEPWTMDPMCVDDDPITECYGVLDPQGFFAEKSENAFYTWNISAGTLFEGTTGRPARDNQWTTPSTPGDVTLWVVTRDGHGGTSACRAIVTVR